MYVLPSCRDKFALTLQYELLDGVGTVLVWSTVHMLDDYTEYWINAVSVSA